MYILSILRLRLLSLFAYKGLLLWSFFPLSDGFMFSWIKLDRGRRGWGLDRMGAFDIKLRLVSSGLSVLGSFAYFSEHHSV